MCNKCLITYVRLTAEKGVESSIPALSHAFVETVILLPSAGSFKKGCCQLQEKVCVNRLVNLAQEKIVVR